MSNGQPQGNALQFQGTGTEARRLMRSIKDAFEAKAKTNDQPYSFSFAIALSNIKQGLNESAVKSYLATIEEAIQKFANSEQLSIQIGIESPSLAYVEASKKIQEIATEAQKVPAFGQELVNATQENFEASQKLEAPVKEITDKAEQVATKSVGKRLELQRKK